MFIDDDSKPLKRAELEERARQAAIRLKKQGQELSPIRASGRNLVSSFWAKAWMRHLGQSEIYGMRLAPGRAYLRYGCVIDFSISCGLIHALVAGEHTYEVDIRIEPPAEEQLALLRTGCSGRLSSWVDVLQGKLSEEVLSLLCEPEAGILPELGNISCSCTCPDWADICKHAAAALYAAGIKLDSEPDLLFTLRQITLEKLLPAAPADSAALDGDKLSSLFGINLDD